MARVTAIFESRLLAEQAITDLRRRGVSDANISVVSRRSDDVEVKGRLAERTGAGISRGAITGAGVGTLFGLAAALIPGAGPFITAGALASVLGTTGGAAAAGAIVGGASGALAAAFARAGFSPEEAEYYAPAVERGGVMVAVETSPGTERMVRAELAQSGGSTWDQATTTSRANREQNDRPNA